MIYSHIRESKKIIEDFLGFRVKFPIIFYNFMNYKIQFNFNQIFNMPPKKKKPQGVPLDFHGDSAPVDKSAKV